MTILAHRLHGPRPQPGEPTLVLLHAYPLNSSMWDGVIARLREIAPQIPVVTLDAPGFGASPSGEDVAAALERSGALSLDDAVPSLDDAAPSLDGAVPSLDTVAAAVEATLTELEIGDLVLAGLSLGGYTALAYAEQYPARLRALALLDTKAEADEEPARKVRIATAAKVLTEGTSLIESSVEMVLGATTLATAPDIVAAVRAEILAAPPRAISWIQRAMAARPDRLHVLRELAIPVLLLRGEEDELSSPASAAAMAEAARAGGNDSAVTLVTLPRTGHMAANESPDEVAQALADLFSAL